VGAGFGCEDGVFRIEAARMYGDGYRFFVSDNGVWLTESVPPRYLQPIPSAKCM
jgi:putative RNA 2'-phosphotransferase